MNDIIQIMTKNNYSKEVGLVIKKLFSIMLLQEMRGFCHASASVLYVCLCELGLQPKLVIGEANIENKYFDHSWVVLDGKIIDLAIALPLDYSDEVGPVILNEDLYTNKTTIVEYDNNSGQDLCEDTKMIIATNFTEYMNNAPYKQGLWSFVKLVLNKEIDIKELQQKYKNTKRYSPMNT
ncbi:MAG: hypothetical protein UH788_07620 [Treponemataceae bacterium]|nr:hypothetical protein [Treponemataceae bacterium]